MEILAPVLIGVLLGLLAGLRVIRSPLTFAFIATSVLAIYGFMAVKAYGIQTIADLGGVLAVIYAYGLGFLFFMALPGGITFGFVTLIRRSCVRRPPRLQPHTRKISFALLGAATFGLIYLSYAVGLLVISRGTDISVSLRNSGPNAPMLWLMGTFGFEEAIKAAPWLEAGYFTAVGILYMPRLEQWLDLLRIC